MKLYHFTPEWMLPGIKKEGLTKGVLVTQFKPPKFKTGYQWLTINGDWNQSWNAGSTLPYDRTEIRLTVKIPDIHKIIKWTTGGRTLINPGIFEALSCYGDPDNWYLYFGKIKPKWIKQIDKNESRTIPNQTGIRSYTLRRRSGQDIQKLQNRNDIQGGPLEG